MTLPSQSLMWLLWSLSLPAAIACNGGIMNVGAPPATLDTESDSGGGSFGDTGSNSDVDTVDRVDAADVGDTVDTDCLWGGTSYQSACWYLGAQGVSCETVCEEKGGYNPLTEALLGIPEQGGDWANCRDIVRLMGFDGEVAAGYRSEEIEGLGCHIWSNGDIWWLYSPPFNPTAGISEAQIICACHGLDDTDT